MKNHGCKRLLIARLGAALGFVCGALGLLAVLTEHTWKLGPRGWLEGGVLVMLIGIFALLDSMFSFQRHRGDQP